LLPFALAGSNPRYHYRLQRISDPALKTVLAIGFGPTASDDMPKRSPNSTPNNPTGGAASMINSRAANGETAAFGEEFAEPFLAHYDGVRGHPCAELCRNGIGSTALRGEVLCRNCNPAALLKNRNEFVIGSLKTNGSDHIEQGER
jgi:hypothetical protein